MQSKDSAGRFIAFTKMHGLGNDYVYVDGFSEKLDGVDVPELARTISDRHCGVGSDGLILIQPPESGVDADVRMEMFNADGSRGEMCGNGIRCVAKYAIDHGLVKLPDIPEAALRVQTDRGVLSLLAYRWEGLVERVRVDMGAPILSPDLIPVKADGSRCVRMPLPLGDTPHRMTCVSMGNPHVVIFVDDLDDLDIEEIGPALERHALFPNRVNVHIAAVRSPGDVAMKTWERGSGITQACGTGACAVLVAGVLEERTDPSAFVHLPGGALQIEWVQPGDLEHGTVLMTGPAVEAFTGRWPL